MIISFYSYKGGAGRTQLCVNVAEYLCYHLQRKVLLWDWDLEAPGIHVFFGRETKTFDHPGTIEMLNHYVRLMRLRETVFPNDLRDTLDLLDPIPLVTTDKGCISLLPGGNYSRNYEYKVGSFDWSAFIDQWDGKSFLNRHVRYKIKALGYDYVLIDSRTGISDYAGLCNILLPDLNVLVVTPHDQSFEGNLKIAEFIKRSEYVKQGYRKPHILPIFSRLDLPASGKAQERLKKFKKQFGVYYQEIVEQIGEPLARYAKDENLYLNHTLLAHEPTLANEEKLLFSSHKEYIAMPYLQNMGHIAQLLDDIAFGHTRSNLRYEVEEKGIRLNEAVLYAFPKLKSTVLNLSFQQPYQENKYLVQLELKTAAIEPQMLLRKPYLLNLLAVKTLVNPKMLFETCFKDEIAQVFRDFIELLKKEQIEQLLFVVSAPESLHHLPFEAILGYFEPDYAQKSLSMHLVRTRQVAFRDFSLISPILKPRPLSVLYVNAFPYLLDVIRHELLSAVSYGFKDAAPVLQDTLAIEYLLPASLREMQSALTARQPEILHLCAYAEMRKNKQIVLYLEDEKGNLDAVHLQSFGEVLQNAPSLRVVVLNLAARQTPILSAIAYQLAAFSISCLVFTQDNWSKDAQITFYRQLQLGNSPAKALAQANLSAAISPEKVGIYQNQVVKGLLHLSGALKPKNSYYALKTLLGQRRTRMMGFVGRKRYWIEMQQAFRQNRSICLYGLGGLGKTTLAEAFAYHYAAQHQAEIMIFKDENQIDESYIIEQLLIVYEKRFQQQAVRLKQLVKTKNSNALDQLKQLMAHYPPNGRLIVLFDNCEGLQKGVNGAIEPANLNEFLKYICVNAPQGCHVLFTTRYRLTEWETEVVHFALDCLTIEEQNQFLDFSPVLRKIPEIERPALYERFQGHPQSYTQLESLMERDKEFHWQRVAEATQVVVFNNLLLQNIYERLLKTEQRFFQQMVLCITHTPYEVLAHLVQQPVEWVEKELKLLENWALCMLDEPAKRFVVHPLVREWMHQQVVSKDFLSNGYIVLGTYFSDNISDINNLNLQNALLSKKYFELAGENGILGFAETALCLQNYFQKIGEYARAVELNDAVLKLNVNRLIQSDALNNLGMIAYFKLEHSESEKHFRASLALRILENNQIRIAESYHNIATLYQDQQLYDEAKAFFNDSLTIKRALSAATAIHPERITLHLTLNNLSQISAAQGDLTEALHYLNESLIIAKKEQDSSAQCTTSMNIADIYLKKEDFDNALKYFSEAEALIDQEALSTDSITLFLNISQLYALRENYTGALEYVLRAFRLARRHSLKENEIRHQLGRILHEAGRQTLEKLVKNL